MISLSDSQLASVMETARMLPVEKRDLYLQRIARMLLVLRGRGHFGDADVAEAAKLAMVGLAQSAESARDPLPEIRAAIISPACRSAAGTVPPSSRKSIASARTRRRRDVPKPNRGKRQTTGRKRSACLAIRHRIGRHWRQGLPGANRMPHNRLKKAPGVFVPGIPSAVTRSVTRLRPTMGQAALSR